jgi:hypothetical protein
MSYKMVSTLELKAQVQTPSCMDAGARSQQIIQLAQATFEVGRSLGCFLCKKARSNDPTPRYRHWSHDVITHVHRRMGP